MSGDMWDKRYKESGFAYGEEPNDFLVSMVSHIPPGEVLCLGGGEGRNAVFLARQGYSVTALDQSSVGLEKATELARRKNVSIATIVADLANYAISPGRYNGIVAIFLHLPPALRQQVHQQILKGLAPGGVFIMEAFAPDQLKYGTGGPRNAALLYGLDDVLKELHGLHFNIAQNTVRDINEGEYHSGKSSVIQICATKKDSAAT